MSDTQIIAGCSLIITVIAIVCFILLVAIEEHLVKILCILERERPKGGSSK